MRQVKHNWPFLHRAIALALVFSILASLLVGITVANSAKAHLQQQAQNMRYTLSKQASQQAADAIFSQDLLSLNVILNGLVEYDDVAYAAVYDLNNQVIAAQGQGANSETTQPMSIRYQNEVIGFLDVRLDLAALNQRITQIYGLWGILSCLLLVICLTLAWLIGTRLGRAIQDSSKDVLNLGKQGYAITQHKTAELNQLSEALQQYHGQQQAKQAMYQALNKFMTPKMEYVDETSQDRPLSELSNHYTHGAILFIDFVSVQAAQAELNPSELAALLNDYYFFINQAAQLYNGHVDKYAGDGVMVVFGIAQSDDKGSFHGTCTALLIIGLINQFNSERQAQGLTTLDFRLGLHTGDLLASSSQSDELSYDAVGDAIHIAAQLCRQSQANRLLISEQALQDGHLGNQLVTSAHQTMGNAITGQALKTYWAENLIPNYQALIERQVQHIASLVKNPQ